MQVVIESDDPDSSGLIFLTDEPPESRRVPPPLHLRRPDAVE
jgi:hypothetical protein